MVESALLRYEKISGMKLRSLGEWSLSLSLVFFFSSASRALSPEQASLELRRATEVASFFRLDTGLTRIQETYEIPTGPIFDQGNTPFCWAYSAFHMLNAYYRNAPPIDETKKWRLFLDKIDTTEKLKDFITRKSGVVYGWPNEAVFFIRNEIQGVHQWISYVPSVEKSGWGTHPDPDTHVYTPKAYFTRLSTIIQMIDEGIIQGIPSSYCTNYHCVTIFGGNFRDRRAEQYFIGDSLKGGSVYVADAQKVHEAIVDVTTLGVYCLDPETCEPTPATAPN